MEGQTAHIHQSTTDSNCYSYSVVALPEEIWSNVFRFILCNDKAIDVGGRHDDMWNFRQVCAQWRNAIDYRSSLWCHWGIRYPIEVTDACLAIRTLLCLKKSKSLPITQTISSTGDLAPSLFWDVTRLQELHLHNVFIREMHFPLGHVKKLSVRHCRFAEPQAPTISEFLKNAPNIEELTWCYSDVSFSGNLIHFQPIPSLEPAVLPFLHTLILVSGPYVEGKHRRISLFNALHAPSLNRIKFMGCHEAMANLQYFVWNSNSKVKRLDLISTNVWELMPRFGQFQDVEELSLVSCYNANPRPVVDNPRSFPVIPPGPEILREVEVFPLLQKMEVLMRDFREFTVINKVITDRCTPPGTLKYVKCTAIIDDNYHRELFQELKKLGNDIGVEVLTEISDDVNVRRKTEPEV